MSLTKPLNSKVNMKQYSNADLPVNPKQPAIARYTAESTANQTTINLPFQIDTVNAADSFLLMVDGKVLTPGSTNDYQFAGVDSFGFSSTISLNYSLSAGLNIQAIKLGLKKETEFVQDARFTALYEGIDQGLQGFVRTSDLMVATSSAGAPGSGLFYSSIQNRASMPDLRTDLKARMGVERIQTQTFFPIPNEFGPNGEVVYGTSNDVLGQIRFVGGAWYQTTDASGNSMFIPTPYSAGTDYVEVTFYGTGLNLLTRISSGTTWDVRSQVDGGTESAGTILTQGSAILQNRNFSPNQIVAVASGLALGVHTVRLRVVNLTGISFSVMGFEILNESATVLVNPGSSYLAGKKATTLAQASLAYNSSFESGTLGTRGGRVVVYQKADGTIAKAVQPVDAAQANLTSANHQNEEVVRVYSYREFGANRSDDFSTLTTTLSDRVFTLDDGTTTLLGDNVVGNGLAQYGIEEGVYTAAANGNFLTLTFVGTGLDIKISSDGTARTHNVFVDGVNVGTLNSTGVTSATRKVVSGLPYGTHTVKFENQAGGVIGFSISKFIVYQPKKPSLPAGTFEIADYNVMANYIATVLNDSQAHSTGVLAKANVRECVYVGTWDASTVGVDNVYYFTISTTTNGNYVEYRFFGTGIEVLGRDSGSGCTMTVQIDGANYTGAASVIGGGSPSWTPGTSTWSVGTASGAGAKLQISGLTLGHHVIRLTKASGTYRHQGFDIITPIHSAKQLSSYVAQNTLAVGSQSLNDSRKTTIVKDAAVQKKNVSQAYGVTNPATTTSTASIPMPEMSVTHFNSSGRVRISYAACMYASGAGIAMDTQVFVDGVAVGQFKRFHSVNNTYVATCLDNFILELSPGFHKIDLCWSTSSGTLTTNAGRTLTVEEI